MRMGDGWADDRARYPANAWTVEPSLWAVAVYRFGQGAHRSTGIRGKLKRRAYRWMHLACRAVLTIEIPHTVDIGPGLRIYHQGAITMNGGVRIGARCRLRQGVTIGVRERDGAVPTLGDDVFIGAFAQILGDVHIGDGAQIGAGAVVLKDVPAGATAVGVPAKLL